MELQKKYRKRYVTLIEIMIVIFLISLIGSVLAFNLKGSLDKGKVFKTEQGIEQIYNILMLDVAQGNALENAVRDWKQIVKTSCLAGKPDTLIRDGWGEEYHVGLNDNRSDIKISSEKLDRYYEKTNAAH